MIINRIPWGNDFCIYFCARMFYGGGLLQARTTRYTSSLEINWRYQTPRDEITVRVDNHISRWEMSKELSLFFFVFLHAPLWLLFVAASMVRRFKIPYESQLHSCSLRQSWLQSETSPPLQLPCRRFLTNTNNSVRRRRNYTTVRQSVSWLTYSRPYRNGRLSTEYVQRSRARIVLLPYLLLKDDRQICSNGRNISF